MVPYCPADLRFGLYLRAKDDDMESMFQTYTVLILLMVHPMLCILEGIQVGHATRIMSPEIFALSLEKCELVEVMTSL